MVLATTATGILFTVNSKALNSP